MALKVIKLNVSQGLTCSAVLGDITKVTADAVVTEEGPDMERESGVTKALTKIAPQFKEVRSQLRKKHSPLDLWSVRTSVVGDPFSRVIHAVLTKEANGDTWLKNMKTLYKNIFKEADRLKIFSIAIPLLGSGTAETERSLSVKAVVTSLLTYSPKYLTNIMLVSNNVKVLDMLANQFLYEQRGISESSEGLFTQICSGIKNFFSPVYHEKQQYHSSVELGQTNQRERGAHYRPHPSQMRGEQTRPSAASNSYHLNKNGGKRGHAGGKGRSGHRGHRGHRGQYHGHWNEEQQIQEALRKSKEEAVNSKKHLYHDSGGKCYFSNSRKEDSDLEKADSSCVYPGASKDDLDYSDSNGSGSDDSDSEIIPDEDSDSGISPNGTSSRMKSFGRQANDKDTDLTCPICLGDIMIPKQLHKCGHIFCEDCIDRSFENFKPVCPSCNMLYGVITGNQPDGTMDVGFSSQSLPGYSGFGTITITYYFPGGIQKKEHPNPGQPYKGVTCRAYLPNCREGKKILTLLRKAFDQRLTFTIGFSTTTGQENSVTWNGIEHKTDKERGTSVNGYPDDWYFVRVKQDLARNGIEEDESHGPVRMGTVNKQETTVSSSAGHGVYRDPATNANECFENLKKEAEKRNLVIRENEAIGDCMFISLSQQLEHVLNQHIRFLEIRRQLVTYLRENPTLQSQTHLSDFLVSETWEEYLDRMGRRRQSGDHIMLIAAANVYKVEIVVIRSTGQETIIEPNIQHGTVPKLILGLISEKHYVSLEKIGGRRTNGRLNDVTTNAETLGVEKTGQSLKQDSHALAEAKIPFPPSWTRMTSNSELFTVSSGCQEYQDVGRRFLSSIGRGQQRTILEIKRVQSKTLWQLYCAKKQDIDSQDPGVQNERVLWHGTKKNSVLPISKKGFNRGFSGQNAAVYGDGVYFAPASSYAAEDTYSVPDDNGYKYVFQARVLTGTYAKGERGMRVPPWRNEEQHLTYDSVVDNVTKPNLYVIFHDAQAYPEYLVTFT